MNGNRSLHFAIVLHALSLTLPSLSLSFYSVALSLGHKTNLCTKQALKAKLRRAKEPNVATLNLTPRVGERAR